MASAISTTDHPARITPAALIALARAGEQLPLRSVNIKAMQSGLYVSPFKGRGMEFDETRLYQPGDDIRGMDWKVTARTGKPHTKLFREERERPVLLGVDLRRSMFFATRGAFKSVVAARAAALLAWSTAAHGDRIGGLLFGETAHRELSPKTGKTGVLRFIQHLCKHPAWDIDSPEVISSNNDLLTHALLRLLNVARPGSLIFLLSDFRGLSEQAESWLSRLARHNDVVMIHISDPLEIELPPPGHYRLSNGTRDFSIDTGDNRFREKYQQRSREHIQHLQQLCKYNRMFFLPLGTSDNVVNTLQTGLGLKTK
jgi:uncharacterized protein (DUF58 family)